MIRDIPRGRTFDDERELLPWLVARLTHPCRTQLKFSPASADEAAQIETTLGLLRAQVVHASAANRLMRTSAREAAYPIVRSMLELWAEIAYLNADGICPERVWAHRLWSLLVLQDDQPAILAPSVGAFRERHPEVFEKTVQRYRKRKTGHASGQPRTALIRQYCGEANARMYKWLSWSCHPVIQGAAHTKFADQPSVGVIQIGHFRSRQDTETDIALVAFQSLFESWRAFHDVFGSRGSHQANPTPDIQSD